MKDPNEKVVLSDEEVIEAALQKLGNVLSNAPRGVGSNPRDPNWLSEEAIREQVLGQNKKQN
jgi:hypothetical protein